MADGNVTQGAIPEAMKYSPWDYLMLWSYGTNVNQLVGNNAEFWHLSSSVARGEMLAPIAFSQ